MKSMLQRKYMSMGSLLVAIASVATLSVANADEQPNPKNEESVKAEISVELLAFVQAQYVHGLPVADAVAQFDAMDEPALLKMLVDDQHEAYRYNIALMLGLVGTDKAVDGLIEFLDSAPEGPVSHARFLAYGTVPHALGFLAERGHKRALNFLLEHASAEAWSDDMVRWTTPTLDREFQPHLMTKLVIWGLSVASRPQSDALLAEMDTGVREGRTPSMYANDIAAGLNRSSRIKTEGVWTVFARAGRAD